MFKASPALAGIFGDEARTGQRGKTRNTVLSRQFPGGSLKIVPSKSPSNLRRHTARILAIDEADAMPDGPEGSPIELVIKRTLTFSDRKIILGSTPIDEETSQRLRGLCSERHARFRGSMPGLRNFRGNTLAAYRMAARRARYAPPIGARHVTRSLARNTSPQMVEAGRWRATAPEVQGHAGFRLNALVSLLHNARWCCPRSRIPESQRLARILAGFRQYRARGTVALTQATKSTKLACLAASSGLASIESRRTCC